MYMYLGAGSLKFYIAPFSVQSIPERSSKTFSETAPWYSKYLEEDIYGTLLVQSYFNFFWI
jgi:hypothetical protein